MMNMGVVMKLMVILILLSCLMVTFNNNVFIELTWFLLSLVLSGCFLLSHPYPQLSGVILLVGVCSGLVVLLSFVVLIMPKSSNKSTPSSEGGKFLMTLLLSTAFFTVLFFWGSKGFSLSCHDMSWLSSGNNFQHFSSNYMSVGLGLTILFLISLLLVMLFVIEEMVSSKLKFSYFIVK